jgi:hypothetical protein
LMVLLPEGSCLVGSWIDCAVAGREGGWEGGEEREGEGEGEREEGRESKQASVRQEREKGRGFIWPAALDDITALN